MWSGAISFGLVNIPVKLYKATASSSGRTLSFHQIHKTCGTRIKHIRFCPKDEVEVPWDEVAKGYEYEKGKYVEIGDEELNEILPPDDYAAITIESFVALAEVDPIYYDRAYYIGPDASPRPYALLLAALRDTGKVALARVRLRTRAHLALVRVLGDHLLLETMFYAHEIAQPDEIPGAGKAQVDNKQLEMAEQLIAAMTGGFDPARYQDDYTAKVEKIIEQKIAGGEVVESLAPAQAEGQVVDLLEALRRSVAAAHPPTPPEKTAGPARAKRPARARASARHRRKAG
jgi:DNA end-binding protein Ku